MHDVSLNDLGAGITYTRPKCNLCHILGVISFPLICSRHEFKEMVLDWATLMRKLFMEKQPAAYVNIPCH